VGAEGEPDPRVTSVDGTLSTWRQGDCVLGEQWFAHRIDRSFALTDAGRLASDADADLAEEQVAGLVVLTQTCDVVRSCVERPYVEVCPLVEVDDERLREIERAQRPGYAFLPLLADRKLVADLDRVMTVEKPLVATWERTLGWRTDPEGRAFALALARKRKRFAFPDDFTMLARKLQSRLRDKHDRNTDEGSGLRALREIRVQASPSWDAGQVDLFFWFIRKDGDHTFEGTHWADLLKQWLKLATPSSRFHSIDGQVVALDDMTAADYVDSDPLDLDHLSTGST
jgi:hypothetical protein